MEEDLNARYGLEPLLGIAELAAYLGVPTQRIYDWRLAGTGPRGYRIGRELKMPLSEVRRWLAEHAEPPAKERVASEPIRGDRDAVMGRG